LESKNVLFAEGDVLSSLGYNVQPSVFEEMLSKEAVFGDAENDDFDRDLDLDPAPEDLADVTKRMSIYERPLKILAFRVYQWKKLHHMTSHEDPLGELAARIRAHRETIPVLAHFIRHWNPFAGPENDAGKRVRDVMYWSMKTVAKMDYNWNPPENYEYTWPPAALPPAKQDVDQEKLLNQESAHPKEDSTADSKPSVRGNLLEESKELEDIDARCPPELQPVLREGMRLAKQARERKTCLLRDGITDIRGFASLIPPEAGDVSRSIPNKRQKKAATKIFPGKSFNAEPKGTGSPVAKKPKTGPAIQFPTLQSVIAERFAGEDNKYNPGKITGCLDHNYDSSHESSESQKERLRHLHDVVVRRVYWCRKQLYLNTLKKKLVPRDHSNARNAGRKDVNKVKNFLRTNFTESNASLYRDREIIYLCMKHCEIDYEWKKPRDYRHQWPPQFPREPKARKPAPPKDDAASKVQDLEEWPSIAPKEPIIKKSAPSKDDGTSKVLDLEGPAAEGSKASVSGTMENDPVGEENASVLHSKPKAVNTEPAVSSKKDSSLESPKPPFMGWHFTFKNLERKFMVGREAGEKFLKENRADILCHFVYSREKDYLSRKKQLADPNTKDPLICSQVASKSQEGSQLKSPNVLTKLTGDTTGVGASSLSASKPRALDMADSLLDVEKAMPQEEKEDDGMDVGDDDDDDPQEDSQSEHDSKLKSSDAPGRLRMDTIAVEDPAQSGSNLPTVDTGCVLVEETSALEAKQGASIAGHASMEQEDVQSEKVASESEVEEAIAAGKTDKEVSPTSFVCRVLGRN
jgi:hypothetical protein